MTMGVLPRSMHSLPPEPKERSDAASAGVVLQNDAANKEDGKGVQEQQGRLQLLGVGIGVGGLGRGVGMLCVKLRTWCMEVCVRCVYYAGTLRTPKPAKDKLALTRPYLSSLKVSLSPCADCNNY